MKKTILIILLIIWMIIVYLFSSQPGEESGKTSGGFIRKALKMLNKDITEEKIKKLQLPIRKLAHFTLYAVGGFIAILLLNQYDLSLLQKIRI